MLGLKILFNSSNDQLDDSLIARFSKGADMPNCSREKFRPAPSLWIQNTCRLLTAASTRIISSDSGRIQVVFHGEVYNCSELAQYLGIERPATKSIADGPDIIVSGIARDGIEFIQRINGSFVLVVWYPQEKKLYLTNDRFGLRPHYYGWRGDTLLLSPTVTEIHQSWGCDTRLDKVGVVEFFSFEQLLGDRTLVEGISVLPPASICEVKRGLLSAKQYWDFPYPDQPLKVSERELCEDMQKRLSVAVNRQLPANGPVGVPLSGGLDSRVLAGIASQSIPNLKVFTFGDQNCLDRKFSAQIAARIGAEHSCVSPDKAEWKDNFHASASLCDGMSPVLHAHILLLRSVLTQKAEVVLDGFAGDMITGGYVDRNTANSLVAPSAVNQLLSKKYFSRLSSSFVNDLFTDKSFTECVPTIREELFKRAGMCQSSRIADVCDYMAYRERVRRFTINGHTLLRDFVEVRAPFFDYDFIDFSINLPVKYRLGKRLYKNAIRDMFPDLRDVGYTPRGETLKHSFLMTNTLNTLRRPDRVISRQLPKSLKAFLRQRLQAICPSTHSYDKGVDYGTVFGEDVASLFPAFDDKRRGWTQLTSYDVIKGILSKTSSEKTMEQATNLSLWLTFQMYREVSGLGEI